jgi:hypothetical protein
MRISFVLQRLQDSIAYDNVVTMCESPAYGNLVFYHSGYAQRYAETLHSSAVACVDSSGRHRMKLTAVKIQFSEVC